MLWLKRKIIICKTKRVTHCKHIILIKDVIIQIQIGSYLTIITIKFTTIKTHVGSCFYTPFCPLFGLLFFSFLLRGEVLIINCDHRLLILDLIGSLSSFIVGTNLSFMLDLTFKKKGSICFLPLSFSMRSSSSNPYFSRSTR